MLLTNSHTIQMPSPYLINRNCTGEGGSLKSTLQCDEFIKSSDSKNHDIAFLGTYQQDGRITKEEFTLAQCQNLPCPCCGTVMKNNSERGGISADIAYHRGAKLVETLNKYAKFLRKGRIDAADEIKQLALQYPKATIGELLRMTHDEHLDALCTKQINVINSFFPTHQKAYKDPKTRDLFSSYFADQKNIIKYATNEGQFKNKKFKDELVQRCKDFSLPIRCGEIYRHFSALPRSTNDKDAFFVKYERRSDYEIANALVKNNCPTIEHIDPFSKSKDNHFSNLLVMCSDCNEERGDEPYEKFIKKHPEMRTNFYNYIEAVKKEIEKPKYKALYTNYAASVENTFDKIFDKNARTCNGKSRHT